jgi:hypothetical protein
MIARATRHVERGRNIIKKQGQLIAEKRAGPGSDDLLKTFEKSQEILSTI